MDHSSYQLNYKQASRTLGRESWEIKPFLSCIKAEIDARGSCQYLNLNSEDCRVMTPSVNYAQGDAQIIQGIAIS